MFESKYYRTIEEAEAYAQGLKDAGASCVVVDKLEVYPVIYRITWFYE